MNIHVVGCGGVASYAVPVLAKLIQYRSGGGSLTLQDKDVLEERNLERQQFGQRSVGLGKAQAMSQGLRPVRATVLDSWFTMGADVPDNTIIFSFVDNHRARRAILDAVDRGENVCAIVAGNGLYCADAYIYKKEWKGTMCDPRVRFPEILTDESGDPTRHCNDEEVLQETGGQTAVANFQAAQYALQLLTAWFLVEGLDEVRGFSPVDIRGTFSHVTVTTRDQLMNGGI